MLAVAPDELSGIGASSSVWTEMLLVPVLLALELELRGRKIPSSVAVATQATSSSAMIQARALGRAGFSLADGMMVLSLYLQRYSRERVLPVLVVHV